MRSKARVRGFSETDLLLFFLSAMTPPLDQTPSGHSGSGPVFIVNPDGRWLVLARSVSEGELMDYKEYALCRIIKVLIYV